ncbi:hypothetical protein PRIPAC_81471, partial [Pristionchus pacificus]|uniref:Uncharacterized protein n=1 Tax=Pristionchus pacificus TaxID=54126 RepID=A0A2A6CLT2_PRIPA
MSRGVQYLVCVFTASLVFLVYLQHSASIVDRAATIYIDERDSYVIPPSLATDDIIDYRRCSNPLRIFVHTFDHPLAMVRNTTMFSPIEREHEIKMALAAHPAATKNQAEACLFLAFLDGSQQHIFSVNLEIAGRAGNQPCSRNINDNVSITPLGSEIIVQANFDYGVLRSEIGFYLCPNVPPFHKDTWQHRPSIMPLKRPTQFSLVVDSFDPVDASGIPQVVCAQKCGSSLHTTSFCLLYSSSTFYWRLLESLRAGCIPVVMSTRQPMPFQDQLDWKLATFRFPRSLTARVPDILENLDKENIMEMRRRGRVFLARIDDAQALSKALVAALAERIHMPLQAFPELHHLRARWNSGRDLTYTPNTLHDVPKMPADAEFDEKNQEHPDSINANSHGLTRDEEQFTEWFQIIVVWNNMEMLPNGTWPEILVPIEFILSKRNSLNSRFLPYDRIETEVQEFLYEYSFNQHPSILGYIDKNRNCEDIAMNYLVAHLSRKPTLKVFSKNVSSKSTKSSLSSRRRHYEERDECMQMLNALYGYNPL